MKPTPNGSNKVKKRGLRECESQRERKGQKSEQERGKEMREKQRLEGLSPCLGGGNGMNGNELKKIIL